MTVTELFDHMRKDHGYISINRGRKADLEAIHYRMHHPLIPRHDHEDVAWKNVPDGVKERKRQPAKGERYAG